MRVIAVDESRKMNVTGIDNHQLTDLPIVTCGGVINTSKGEVIAIFHQYADIKTGRSIQSSGQLEHFKNRVFDQSIKVDGLQCIITPYSRVIPLDVKNGLPYMKIRPYTDEEWDSLSHITMTGDNPWNPKCLDAEISSGSEWENFVYGRINHVTDSAVDSYGRYKYSAIDPSDIMVAMAIHSNTDMLSNIPISYEIHKRVVTLVKNYDHLRKYFLHLPSETTAKTYGNSTQYARYLPPQLGATIRDTYKSPFPALNVKRQNEAVATTDTFSCDTAAVGLVPTWHNSSSDENHFSSAFMV
jgi:hypothetical protein